MKQGGTVGREHASSHWRVLPSPCTVIADRAWAAPKCASVPSRAETLGGGMFHRQVGPGKCSSVRCRRGHAWRGDRPVEADFRTSPKLG